MVAGAVALVVAGCGAPADRDSGRLDAAWAGASKGRMNGPAKAIWCHAAKLAQVTATQGDTGLGLLIHPTDSLVAGPYRILQPAGARATSPGAALGLRLITAVAVVGYQASGGTLILDQVRSGGQSRGTRISGRFDAKASAAATPAGSITVQGRFLDVPVAPGGEACPR
jgi:hypothetical protein